MVVKMLEYMKMEVGVWRSPGPLVHFLGSQEAGQPGRASKELLEEILLWRDHDCKYGPYSATKVTKSWEKIFGLLGSGSTWGQDGDPIMCGIESGRRWFFTTGPFLWHGSSLNKNRTQNLCNFDTRTVSLRHHGFKSSSHWAAHLLIKSFNFVWMMEWGHQIETGAHQNCFFLVVNRECLGHSSHNLRLSSICLKSIITDF